MSSRHEVCNEQCRTPSKRFISQMNRPNKDDINNYKKSIAIINISSNLKYDFSLIVNAQNNYVQITYLYIFCECLLLNRCYARAARVEVEVFMSKFEILIQVIKNN